ncbi:hypothetical protein RHSIM_Rhsim05G0063300 [Rhododendron simsii]|uniref:Uncharacterized protein n=1 Tax=Rhododendron simsii TaxID=118357 RepID=A0A834H1X8_RHOSS|nr:hypothetical protein RHSIM_Rhsim05G0063300 [Rhododendron simsii]
MRYQRCCRPDPIPQPFPVLLILALVALFLFIKRFLSFELAVIEAPEVSLVCSGGGTSASVTAGPTTAIARGKAAMGTRRP